LNTEEQVKKHKLTVYLIKDTYESIDDFLSVDDFQRLNLNPENSDQGTLIYKGDFRSKPGWVSIFRNYPTLTLKVYGTKALKRFLC